MIKRIQTFFEPNGSLKSKRRSASFWSIMEFGGTNALRLVSNVILTRLLAPEIFGLIALAQVFLTGLQQLSDTGIHASVVRSERGDQKPFLQTAWSANVLRGFLICGVACIIAWPLSRLYEEPVLFPVLCLLSVSVVIYGFSSISGTLLGRELDLKAVALMTVFTKFLTLLVTVTAAYLLGSVWAIVIGILVAAVIYVALSHKVLPPFEHRFRFEPQSAGELFRFGRWIVLGTALTYFGNQGLIALQGIMVPLDVLGLISIAVLIGTVPTQLIHVLLARVVFPVFSTIYRTRRQDLPRALAKVRLGVVFGAFPVLCLISVLAQPIIDFLYDDRYAAAGSILSIYALNGALTLAGAPQTQMLLTLGRSDLHAALMFTAAVLSIAGVFIGFWWLGTLGMFMGVAAAGFIQFCILLIVMRRQGYPIWGPDLLGVMGLIGFYIYTYQTLDVPPLLAPL
jgi:O-antigen/teichoic acid export membrane protein